MRHSDMNNIDKINKINKIDDDHNQMLIQQHGIAVINSLIGHMNS